MLITDNIGMIIDIVTCKQAIHQNGLFFLYVKISAVEK